MAARVNMQTMCARARGSLPFRITRHTPQHQPHLFSTKSSALLHACHANSGRWIQIHCSTSLAGPGVGARFAKASLQDLFTITTDQAYLLTTEPFGFILQREKFAETCRTIALVTRLSRLKRIMSCSAPTSRWCELLRCTRNGRAKNEEASDPPECHALAPWLVRRNAHRPK